MIRILPILCAVLASTHAWPANTSISNGESGLSVRNKLNTQLNQQFNVRQPPYNALANGSDDQPAIQSAINDACAVGGQVYFPTGSYFCRVNSHV
jgi:polygalacturonase